MVSLNLLIVERNLHRFCLPNCQLCYLYNHLLVNDCPLFDTQFLKPPLHCKQPNHLKTISRMVTELYVLRFKRNSLCNKTSCCLAMVSIKTVQTDDVSLVNATNKLRQRFSNVNHKLCPEERKLYICCAQKIKFIYNIRSFSFTDS